MWRWLVLLAAAACQVNEPDIEQPAQMTADAPENVFADTLIAFNSGGETTTCTTNLPECGPVTTGDCATGIPAATALGPDDAVGFTLDAHGVIEVAFRCNFIYLHGVNAGGAIIKDLRIYTGGSGRGVVEVSYDGTVFVTLAPNPPSEQTSFGAGMIDLSLTATPGSPLPAARFVRISDATGEGGLVVDAVEALPAPPM